MLRRKKKAAPGIVAIEREVGLSNGTFTDEWVAEIQEKLDAAGITSPKKREFFSPPILEKRPQQLVTTTTHSLSAVPSYGVDLLSLGGGDFGRSEREAEWLTSA